MVDLPEDGKAAAAALKNIGLKMKNDGVAPDRPYPSPTPVPLGPDTPARATGYSRQYTSQGEQVLTWQGDKATNATVSLDLNSTSPYSPARDNATVQTGVVYPVDYSDNTLVSLGHNQEQRVALGGLSYTKDMQNLAAKVAGGDHVANEQLGDMARKVAQAVKTDSDMMNAVRPKGGSER